MEALMDRAVVAEITSHFEALNSFVPLHPIHDDREYKKAVFALNQLLDAGAAEEIHPLSGLVTTLGTLIGAYEDIHNPVEAVPPVAVIRFLMGQHQLTQSDLPELGTQGVVSEILRGIRDLNVRQIKALSKRFQVPPNLFL
ncbi:HTH-type transcriptional regulator/antitoxin HigA [Oxalobacteraceae bacterium GrIS 1.11]